VSRVLTPGGTFITQQVDMHNDDDLYQLLGLPVPKQPDSWLPLAQRQLQEAGLAVQIAQAAEERQYFHDVAGVIYYLRVIPWAVPEYSFEGYAGRLRELHETAEAWPATVRQRRFLVAAAKPPG
jgi:hypothetical protein